jgi:hypothetical protein
MSSVLAIRHVSTYATHNVTLFRREYEEDDAPEITCIVPSRSQHCVGISKSFIRRDDQPAK